MEHAPNSGSSDPRDAHVVVEGLVKEYEVGGTRAVDDLSLSIQPGEFLVLLGPSGCGKTTTMRCLVGLEEPTSGVITVGGKTLYSRAERVNVPANKRAMGMVFQSYAIWPHKTVRQNISFPLEMEGVSRGERRERVDRMLEVVGLEGLGDRPTSNLSGGQMQRVALARSCVMQPSVLLLDEPLSNLDAKLREKLRFELRELQQEFGITSVYVTHDQSEALALADRIAVMRAGKIVQLDTPRALYQRPVNRYVADFLGASNMFDVQIIGAAGPAATVGITGTDMVFHNVALDSLSETSGPLFGSIRPEDVSARLVGEREALQSPFGARVKVASFLGSQVRLSLEVSNGLVMHAIVPAQGSEDMRPGAHVVIDVPATAVQVLTD